MTGSLVIPGVPVPQGSKKPGRVFYKGGKPRASVIDDNGPTLKAWRKAGAKAILEQYPGLTEFGPLIGWHVPVAVSVRFVFPYRVADRAEIRRADKAGPCQHVIGCVHLPWHTVKPDSDKCLRALFDVLTIGHVWADDAQCCRVELLAYRGPNPMTVVHWVPLDTQH
jgi:Holliday junction resolvase RusA-like endonuclease